MGRELTGRDVRITADGRVWVRVVRGWFAREESWVEVAINEIALHHAHAGTVETRHGHFGIRDLGVNFRELSRILGMPRVDRDGSMVIWESSRTVKGPVLVIDFEAGELIDLFPHRTKDHIFSGFVWPFSAIAAVWVPAPGTGEPQLVERLKRDYFTGYLSLAGFPVDPREVARRVGVPVVEKEPRWDDRRPVWDV